jgi:hypothetical protein
MRTAMHREALASVHARVRRAVVRLREMVMLHGSRHARHALAGGAH